MSNRIPVQLRRFGLPIALAILGTVSLAAGVFAATINNKLPTTAKAFSSHSCDGPFEDLPAGTDGWHFIAPDSQGEGFTSLTLNYSTPGGPVVVGPITSTNANQPDTGAGWSGWIAFAGNDPKHAYVITTAGWELTGGSAVLIQEKSGATFNLSHTCPGTPSSTPSPSPSVSKSPSKSADPSPSPSVSRSPSPSPSASPSPSPSVSPSPSPSPSPSVSPSVSPSASPSKSLDPSPSPSPSVSPSPSASLSPSPPPPPPPGGELPKTGSSVSTLLIIAGLAMLIGAGLLMIGARRPMVIAE